MTADFAEAVEALVGPALSHLGFVLDEVDRNVDEGGRSGAVVYYRTSDCKIQIYESSREGNINCMIAPISAPNEFGPHDRSLTWRFLNEFSPTPEVSLEELAKTVSYKAKSESEQLRAVRDRILDSYDDAHAAILQK